MRILHVVQTSDGGGIVNALHLAVHAVAGGNTVRVLTPGMPSTEVAGDGIATHTLPRAGKAVALARAARRADLVHVHGTRAASWALPVLALRPSVVTFHGLHPLRRDAGPFYRSAARRLIRVVSRLADAVVCVSEEERRDLAAVVSRSARIRLVRNAVPARARISDVERRGARQRLRIDQDTFVVLFPGRLREEKNPRAAIAIIRGFPQPDRPLLLVGGDGPLRPILERELGDGVRFAGGADGLREALAAADVVLNTSRWEGLSLALLEAMWAGRPVVAARIRGNVEALGDGGLLVDSDDFAGFRSALLRLRDRAAAEALAARARERVKRHFSFEEMLAATDGVYAEVLVRNGNARP